MISLEMLYDAKNVLKDIVRLTPLSPAPGIGDGIYIKSENLQLTGSFKLRGAYYKIHSLTAEEKSKGVIACSAGNHAQGDQGNNRIVSSRKFWSGIIQPRHIMASGQFQFFTFFRRRRQPIYGNN